MRTRSTGPGLGLFQAVTHIFHSSTAPCVRSSFQVHLPYWSQPVATQKVTPASLSCDMKFPLERNTAEPPGLTATKG